MPYKDKLKEKARSLARRDYFREYRRKHSGKQARVETQPKGLGGKGEIIALKALVGSKRIYRPSDLKWEGKLVEVKTAVKQRGNFIQWTTKETKQSSTYRWKFFLRQLRKVDLFFIVCQDEEGRTQHIFLIPDEVLNKKNLSISENRVDKYEQYRLTLQ